jgi:hypothetical protein
MKILLGGTALFGPRLVHLLNARAASAGFVFSPIRKSIAGMVQEIMARLDIRIYTAATFKYLRNNHGRSLATYQESVSRWLTQFGGSIFNEKALVFIANKYF